MYWESSYLQIHFLKKRAAHISSLVSAYKSQTSSFCMWFLPSQSTSRTSMADTAFHGSLFAVVVLQPVFWGTALHPQPLVSAPGNPVKRFGISYG